jgi:sugar/nucleoside kinase (ribokinase family)
MDVACLGILVADIFVEPVDQLPEPGELRTTERLLFSPGGCAANVAIDLRRLNRTVSIIGRVGQDALGSFVVSSLQEKGVHTEHIQLGSRPTSATVIINVRGQDRRYLHCIGANGEFSAADCNFEMLKGVRILYVGGYLAMPGFGAADLAELFRFAQSQGLITVLDVVIPFGMRDPSAAVIPALPFTDYFLPNEDEARLLTGELDVHRQVSALTRHNSRLTLVVTRGAKGSIATRNGETIEIPGYAMRSVDESGAGDAFAAGIIAGILEEWPLDSILRFASAVGGSCTRELGCAAGVFNFDQACEYLKANDPSFEFPAGSKSKSVEERICP